MEPNYNSCPTHCCPRHGCKYGYGTWAGGICPVVSGAVRPVYPHNNGCEQCEDDRSEAYRLIGEGLVSEPFEGYDALAAVVWAYEAYANAKDPIMQAHYLIELSNAMSDLASWHPDYNIETGEIEYND